MTSSTFPQILWNCTDDIGTIRWSTARQAAEDHNLWEEFRIEFSHLWGERIDTGELLTWLGY
jgi:hypothetical protein